VKGNLDSYRAALVEFRDEGAYDSRAVYLEPDGNRLFTTTSESVNESAELLINGHWEYLRSQGYGEIFHEVLDIPLEDAPADGWDPEHLTVQLTRLRNETLDEIQAGSVPDIKDTEWHRLLEEINGVLPDNNYITVPIAGDLFGFARAMIRREPWLYRPLGKYQLSDGDARRLAEWSILAAPKSVDELIWIDNKEYFNLFYQVVDTFNDYHV